ncbi:MAG: polysulfide reductase [Verrucomicrobia bacterium]|nr:MAG: polysulfide reductase [Verrucomicrobiota bacterium]
MTNEVLQTAAQTLPHVSGYVYPNEQNVVWSVLIVLYPYITGLVAGAFILASLVRVFRVTSLEPAYRLCLLTSLAFLLGAPLPLLFHLGHPERCYEAMMTPHMTSPMAMFGFVYAWYLMVVLLLELWFDYRRDFVKWGRVTPGWKGWMYRIFTLGVTDLSEKALHFDHQASKVITVIGIPSAILLHGYVGFIFGSIKANPLWGNVLMPIIFILSAIVSGVALCLFMYMVLCWIRRQPVDMACLDSMARALFAALLVAAAVEGLDWFHRIYEAEESIAILKQLAVGKLFNTLIITQAILGALLPLLLLGFTLLSLTSFFRHRFAHELFPVVRRRIYFLSSVLVLIGVLAMRWNVVIGGQLFSKSLRGFTTYMMELGGHEGWGMAVVLLIFPFVLLAVFIRLFLPEKPPAGGAPTEQSRPAEAAA